MRPSNRENLKIMTTAAQRQAMLCKAFQEKTNAAHAARQVQHFQSAVVAVRASTAAKQSAFRRSILTIARHPAIGTIEVGRKKKRQTLHAPGVRSAHGAMCMAGAMRRSRVAA